MCVGGGGGEGERGLICNYKAISGRGCRRGICLLLQPVAKISFLSPQKSNSEEFNNKGIIVGPGGWLWSDEIFS